MLAAVAGSIKNCSSETDMMKERTSIKHYF